jgi:hypothetical protein
VLGYCYVNPGYGREALEIAAVEKVVVIGYNGTPALSGGLSNRERR